MKSFVVIQRKHGVSIHMEDTAAMQRETMNLTWPEFSTLWWSLQECKDNPAFKLMEPRAKRPTDRSDTEFVKHITLETPE